MYSILTITFVIFDVVSSFETEKTNELSKREKRQFAPVIPSEVKGTLF